ncbi:DUF4041 domain-containing protein [Laceyella putida]|uniref:DUF4041 domain-containing protein n=2 Tax=Laceyella putida TaxID=110101 RepID=A0ABW2RR69_9BACL
MVHCHSFCSLALYHPCFHWNFLVVRQAKYKRKLIEEWEKSGFGDLIQIQEQKEKVEKQIKDLEVEKGVWEQRIKDVEKKKLKREEEMNQTIETLTQEIATKKKEIVILDEELLYQSFGIYEPKYNLTTSAEYKTRLDEIRAKQKQLVKEGRATDHVEGWTLEGSAQKGRAMNKNNIKMAVRSLNIECDEAISKVKFNNIETMEKKIRKAYDTINKINKYNRISIRPEYLQLKLDELYLAYEYEQKKQEELEEQRRIKERMREEKRVQEEIERMKKKIEKEETHFKQAIEDLNFKMLAANEKQKALLEEKIRELEAKLAQVEKDKEKVLEREQNTRAGYVYVISNIGSFGENVYKIGMTRRLEPMDRVKELGDASVPFTFDVHAMIFSEDAPQLEKALHMAFHHKRLNKVNERKEFFRVNLEEIEKVVKENHNKVVEFTKLAQAEEYRKSIKMEEENKLVAVK